MATQDGDSPLAETRREYMLFVAFTALLYTMLVLVLNHQHPLVRAVASETSCMVIL